MTKIISIIFYLMSIRMSIDFDHLSIDYSLIIYVSSLDCSKIFY